MKKVDDQKKDLSDFSLFEDETQDVCDYFIINTFENQFLFTSLKVKEVEDNNENKNLIIIKG